MYTPEQLMGVNLNLKAEYDRLYLEKCQEVNELEQRVEKFKNMAEIAVKQKQELENRVDGQKALLYEQRVLLDEANQTIREMKKPPLVGDLIRRGDAINEIQAAFEGVVIYPVYMQNYDVDYIKSQYKGKITKVLDAVRSIPAVSNASTIRELAAEPLKGFTPDVEEPEPLPEELMEELPLWALQPVTSQDLLCLSSAMKNLHEINTAGSYVLHNKLASVLEQKIKEYCGED